MIEIEGITFSYGKHSVFDNFSLLMRTNLFGVIGPNGAGKSTLLKLITGLLSCQTGNLNVNDTNLANDRYTFLQKIGVLFENPQFPSWWITKDHLIWVGMLRGLSPQEAYRNTILLLKEFELADRKNDYVKELSAGLRQRFGILQAIIGVPEVILLDEPTSNLDVKSRRFVLEYLKNLAEDNNSQIIIFSHILSDLEDFCEEIGILNKGKLIFQNKIANIMIDHQPKKYVAKITNKDLVNIYAEKFENLGIEVLKQTNFEIIFKINDPVELESIQNMGFEKIMTIKPKFGVLEELYLNLTS